MKKLRDTEMTITGKEPIREHSQLLERKEREGRRDPFLPHLIESLVWTISRYFNDPLPFFAGGNAKGTPDRRHGRPSGYVLRD